jgi:hypothetical protein
VTGRSLLARAAGLVPFGVGIGLLTLGHIWTTDLLQRPWLGRVLLVALLLGPLIWPLANVLTTGHLGFGGLGRFFERRLRSRRRRRASFYMDRFQNMMSTAEHEGEVRMPLYGPRFEIEFWLWNRPGEVQSATALADVLTASENSWRRYGYDAGVMTPRLLEVLPEELGRELRRRSRTIDAWAAAAVGAALVVPSAIVLAFPLHIWVGVAIDVVVAAYAAVIAQKSYARAVRSAVGYIDRLDSAVDLYRFKLLEHLHLPLPLSAEVEAEHAHEVSLLLRQGSRGVRGGGPAIAQFRHPVSSDTAAAERMAEIVNRDIPEAVSASIQREFTGPQLIRFEGRVGARVSAAERGWSLAVAIGAIDLPFKAQHSEALIVPGIAAEEAVFMVVPESDTLSVVPPRAALEVAGNGTSETAFELAPLMDASEHHVWLNVLQEAELVQVLPVTIPA